MFNIITARRRAREAEAARQQAAEAAEKKKREDAYKAHVKAVDLNGIATRHNIPLRLYKPNEEVSELSELEDEVKKRLRLAAKLDPQIKLADKMSDEDIAAITGKLDRTALRWLLQHGDPVRQRDAATSILDARADLNEAVSLDRYVMIVGEAVARERAQMRPGRVLAAVSARAILLRSVDPRWSLNRSGKKTLRLSDAP